MTPVVVPKLSMSGEDVRIATWLVPDGSNVIAGQPIVEIETEKATLEIEAPTGGLLHIVAFAGADAAVDSVIANIAAGDEHLQSPAPANPVPALEASGGPSIGTGDADGDGRQADAGDAAVVEGTARVVASPAARRLASSRGIALATIAGSGPGGRVLVEDVNAVLDQGKVQGEQSAELTSSVYRPGRDLVLRGLVQSWSEIPHIQISGTLDAARLMAARASIVDTREIRVTVNDLLIHIVASALTDVPELNGTLGDDGVRTSPDVHLAIAVATDAGVVAPTLRGASNKTLATIVSERARLVDGARAGTLEKRDFGGATCTLSNLGGYPVDYFAPIITGPQIAVVAVGRISDHVVPIANEIGVRPRVVVNIAIDHRAADGVAGGRLLAAIQTRLDRLPDQIPSDLMLGGTS